MKNLAYKNIFSEDRLFLFLIVIVSFFALVQVSHFEFLSWDDNMIITQNPYVTNLSQETLNHNFEVEHFTFLPHTIFSLFYQIWGENPFPYHCFSIVLHLLNIVLVFRLLKHFSIDKWGIYIICILFAMHPTRVESVAWISETKGLLLGSFSLLAFDVYIRYLKSNLKTSLLVLASVLVILASLSKMQGLLLPFSFILFDIYFKRKIGLISIIEKIVLVLLLIFLTNSIMIWGAVLAFIIFLIIKARVKEEKLNLKISIVIIGVVIIAYLSFMTKINDYFEFFRGDPDSILFYSLPERLLLAGQALAIYFRTLLFPVSLSAIYPYPSRMANGDLEGLLFLWVVIIIISVIVSVFLIVKHKKINPIYIFGWFFFLINISIVLHIIPIEGRIIAANRYTYLPFLGLFIIIGFLFTKAVKRLKIGSNSIRGISIAILVLLASLSYSRAKVWVNTKTLFTDVINKKSDVSFVYSVIGSSYLNKNLPDSAILYLNKAIELDPKDPTPYFNRGIALRAKSEFEGAIDDFEKFISVTKVDKNKAEAYANIGEIYRNSGNDSLALQCFNKAIRLNDELSVAYNRRGLYYLGINDLSSAIVDFSKAVKYNQFNAEAINNLGLGYMMDEDFARAEELFNQAIDLSADYALAYDNRAYLKYLQKDFQGAIQDYNKEIRITPKYYQAYVSRGRVYASMGNFTQAINDFNIALENDTIILNALTNRAFAHYYLGDIEKAELDFKSLTYKYPQDLQIWQNTTWFYRQIKKTERAVECLLKIIELDNKSIYAYSNLGSIYLDLNDLNLANHYLNIGFELDSKNPEIMFLLGDLHRLQGNTDVACDYYQKSSSLNYEPAINALNKYCVK